jgi:hypothetical protein
MFAHPKAFTAQNSHRIALFQPDVARPDLDRIEDIGADAIGTARTAVAYLEKLSYETTKPIQGVIRTITTQVEKRRVLTDDFRHAVTSVLKHLAREDYTEEMASDLDHAMRCLRDALNLSHRVQDLLAAEKDIGWHRGIKE